MLSGIDLLGTSDRITVVLTAKTPLTDVNGVWRFACITKKPYALNESSRNNCTYVRLPSCHHHHKYKTVAVLKSCVKLILGHPFLSVEKNLDHRVELTQFIE